MRFFRYTIALTFMLFTLATSCSNAPEDIIEDLPTATPEPEPEPEPEQPDELEPEPEQPKVEALTPDMVYEALGLGWNLGNGLDAHANGVSSETCWGNPAATQALFDAVKRAGFKSVRIPITWMGHIGPAPEYKIDPDWLDRVAEVVGYAENAGLRAIINIHHDGANSDYWLNIKTGAANSIINSGIEEEIAALWRQIAEKFADKGEFLIFETMNEIHDGGWGWGANRTDGGKQYKTFNHWQQVAVDAIRSTGGNNLTRWIGVPTYCTNIDLGGEFTLPYDPSGRLMVSIHCYEPHDYTLSAKYSEWGHTGAAGKKPQSDEKTLTGELDKVVRQWTSKGIPAYIGEFGCVHRDNTHDEAFRQYYLDYYTKAASDRKLPIIYWDNGYSGSGEEMSGLFDRGRATLYDEAVSIVNGMMRSYFSPGVSLTDIYNSAPK